VLQYATADTSPPPLRVAVGSYYRPEPGLWLPWGRPWRASSGEPDLSANPKIPEPTGLSPDVPRGTFALDVHRNLLADPFLAAPYPLIGAELAGIEWGADYQTQSVRVARRPDSYTVSYWHLEPTAAMLRSAPPLSDRSKYLFDLDLRLEEPYVARVSSLARKVTSGKTSAYDQAMAIQQYLRADGGFTYSLTLAPHVKTRTGLDAGLDPLSNFLITKKGYCVQFATAMVMMSRAVGIPARIALGFIPGTESKGVWTVLASDAHAWPELYFEGTGWVRFEPTPASRAPALPGYARTGGGEEAPAQATPGASAASTASVQPGPAASRRGAPEQSTTAVTDSTPFWQSIPWRWLGALGGLALLAAAPAIAAAASRRRRWRTAHRPQEVAAAGWDDLRERLGDLGVAWARSWTPRAVLHRLSTEHDLDGVQHEALARLAHGVETAWYAPPDDAAAHGGSAQDVDRDRRQARSDSDLVVGAVAAGLDPRRRRRALLFPRSGMAVLTGERRRERADLAGRSGSVADGPDHLTVGSGERRG